MAEHRVPMLGAALRRRPDPAKSRDPRVRELVAALGTVEPAPAPRPEFKAELRAQLVAVAPRLVAEGKAAAAPAARSASSGRSAQRARMSIKKPVFAIVGALCAFVLLLGGAVLLSRGALPGDALYGVKRASEDTEYSLTGGAVDRGKLKLEFAARRIGEVADLLPRASALAGGSGVLADGGQISANTSKLVRQTLGSADGDVYKAAVLLGNAAVNGKSASPLTNMTTWAPGQITKMRAILARIPAGSLHHRAAASLAVIEGARTRAVALQHDVGCSCLDTANSDRFGPLPCTTGCGASTPRTGGGSLPGRSGGATGGATQPGGGVGTGSTRTSTKGSQPGGGAATNGGGATGGNGGNGGAGPQPGQSTTKPGLPLPVLPTLPVNLPTPTTSSKVAPPVSIDSCGVHATIAGIGIGLGTC